MNPAPDSAPRVLLATWGTTGDIAPYTGLALGLRDAGHHVTVATSRRHAPRFADHGLPVHTMPLDRQEALMAQRKPWRERLRNGQDIATTAARTLLEAAGNGTDVLLAHPLMHPLCAVIADALRLPCLGVYTVSHAMILPRLMTALPWRQHAVADTAVKTLLHPMYAPALTHLADSLGTPSRQAKSVLRTLRHRPVLYGISDALLPRGFRLPPGHATTGYWPAARPPGWQPDARLQDFLDSGSAPVYFGFGSMSRIDSEHLSRTIVSATKRLRTRAVIQSGWAGLHGDTDDVLTIGECPHDWLFPRVRAAVHHAGPGTTHASLNAGTLTLPVPVGLDQPYWAARLTALGAAPAALPLRHLTTDRLTGLLQRSLHHPGYRHATDRVATGIRRHDGIHNVVTHLRTLRRWS
ncbi:MULTISPECIES: glycosyltransferase [unclassified Kitasatospora]|uniref:glycosyltransferase n=1 Tax=unclassified Kitasatospora TaxID=2633591 RepID=UPI0033CB2D2B